MRNLVPRFVLDRYARGESGGRFEAACFFADIAGFSAATNALSRHGSEAAETLAETMQALFDPLVRHVHAHGGFVATFAGDAFTALFPLADGSSALLHALAAALAIQQHMTTYPEPVTRYGSFPLAIRLGLGVGEVEWGILRPGRAGTGRGQNAAYFFSGPAVEAAVAAEHQAQPGQLVLDPAVYAQAQSVVRAVPLDDGHMHCLAATGDLPAPQPEQPVYPSAAEAAFVPLAVREHESAGDFRLVVTVFVRLLGIENHQDLDIFMQAVFELLDQFGGYLGRVDFGDKGCNLLLYWGMPTGHENDVQRALGFVLELGNYTPGTFRAGLAQRLMYAGVVGSVERGEYTCYGDGINLAARLMQAAPWGSIWLDERMAGRARAHFVTEYVEEREFKGFAEKQAMYELIERRSAGESLFQGQLVGREAELAALSAFIQPLFAPAGAPRYAGMLAVVGEAGQGKSRLVQEFLAALSSTPLPLSRASFADALGEGEGGRGEEVRVFLCQTDPILRQPLNPFRYWLMSYLDQSPTQSAERNKRAFSRKLDQLVATMSDAGPGGVELGQELNRTRSCLGALVGLEWESSLYARLDAQGRYENTMQALKALLKAESRRQPVVLVLEDAHWLDEDSQEFVRRLGRQVEEYPLAVLATARPERAGALFGAGYPYRQLDLGCLSAEEMSRLAADRLGGPPTPELLELLAQRAENNPFFAEQILLYLREQGRLACREGSWGLVGAGGAAGLPDEVRAIFSARIDRLAVEIRAVVQAAAILGREFEVRLLAAMLRVDDESGEVPAELVELVARAEQETIWGALAELRYLFRHALLRDAAYEMQLQVHRRGLHQAAAEALERLYAAAPSTRQDQARSGPPSTRQDQARSGQGLPPHYGEIAYHYEAACRQGLEEVRSQACHYLEQAGRQASARYENAAAVDYYSRALALLPADREERRIELLLAREAVYCLLAKREEQRADLQALAELVDVRRRQAEQAELALREARLAQATGDFARSQVQAQVAVAAAQAAGAIELEARAQRAWGVALWRQGNPAGAQARGQAALLLAQAAGRPDLQGNSLELLGNLAWTQLDFAAARRYHEQALAIYRELGDRMGEGIALNNLGNAAHDQGDDAAARRYYEQALSICREIGDRHGEGAALNNLGNVAGVQGDYAAARRYYEQGLAIYRQVGDRRGEIIAFDNLADIAEKQGDYAAARRCCERPLDIYRELGNRRGESLVLSNIGGIAEKQGDYAAARRFYDQALLLARESDTRRGEAIALRHLGELASTMGDYGAARPYLEQALAIFREIDNREGAGRTLLSLGSVASTLGDYPAAQQYLEQSLAIYRQAGSPQDECLVLHGLGQAAFTQGDYAAALRYCEQALDVGRKIGFRWIEGRSLYRLGQVAFAQGDNSAACCYYEQALVIAKELALVPAIAETLIELARVKLARGDLDGAWAGMLELLPILAANPHLDGTDHPRRALLACGRVLEALEDPRGVEILATARAWLQEQAAAIEDEAARRMFLENIPENRELAAGGQR